MPDRLGEFLKVRRASVTAEQIGLAGDGRPRRVPGLRRDELARLAGVSVDYYIRLEQGRADHPSRAVLVALARALQLTYDESEHLFNLARLDPPPERPADPDVSRVLHAIVPLLTTTPVLLIDTHLNLLDHNALADAVFSLTAHGDGRPNIAKLTFLDPEVRVRYPDWEGVAGDLVAYLRMRSGRSSQERDALIDELSQRSPDFVRIWQRQQVKQRTTRRVRVLHPEVGELELTNIWLSSPTWGEETLVIYTVDEGSDSQRRLTELAARAAGDQLGSSPPSPASATPLT